MEFKQALNISQNQKLIMTPELRQAINILQLSTVELNSFINQELIENPVLDIEENNRKEDNKNEMNWEDYVKGARGAEFPKEKHNEITFEEFTASEVSLKENLDKQLSFYNLDKQKYKIAQYIIGNLDEKGYFLECDEGHTNILKISPQKLEQVLFIIHDLEPTGIGARNLKECLEIQLKKEGKLTNEISLILKHYLKEIANGNLKKVAKELKVSIMDVQQMVDTIRKLNPKPAANYALMNDNKYIEADVVIKEVAEEYVVIINDSNSPRLIINSFYQNILTKEIEDEELKEYIEKNLNKAIGLIKSIEQRRETLLKITNNLLKQQMDFMKKGNKNLVPLTLEDVAIQVNVHESTVSRVITNKYVQTPQGLFPLKYFFSEGMKNTKGYNISTTSIKELIAEMIEKENPKQPYSDNMLTALLEKKGLKIARRTVAKYRNELGILSSKMRKRY